MGFALAGIGPGRAVLRFTVEARHLNSASCSHGIQTLAQHADIHRLKPVREGDVLTATASEVSRAGRTAVYDVAVANVAGELVATLRGMTRSTGLAVGAGLKKK